jgi:lipoyl(octanoyl) transferase
MGGDGGCFQCGAWSRDQLLKSRAKNTRTDLSHDVTTCWIVDLGPIRYGPASVLQRRLVEARKAHAIPDVLLFCEHPHTITLGRNAHPKHLRASDRVLEEMHVELHSSDRGGDVTYHGPGQVVGYPILDLTEHRRDIGWYVDQLEEVMIRASSEFGVAARRLQGHHGVWVDVPGGEEKIGALGVHISRWVTSHGFAYNVSANLRYFDLIVPCGIAGKGVTSLERVLGHPLSTSQLRTRLASNFSVVFNRHLQPVAEAQLAESLLSRQELTPDVLTSTA